VYEAARFRLSFFINRELSSTDGELGLEQYALRSARRWNYIRGSEFQIIPNPKNIQTTPQLQNHKLERKEAAPFSLQFLSISFPAKCVSRLFFFFARGKDSNRLQEGSFLDLF